MFVHLLIPRLVLCQLLLLCWYCLDPRWYGVGTDFATPLFELIIGPLVWLCFHKFAYGHRDDIFEVNLNVLEKLLHAFAFDFRAIAPGIIHKERLTILLVDIRRALITSVLLSVSERIKVADGGISVPLGLLEQLNADVVGHLLADDLLHLLYFRLLNFIHF